ncbi:hypothetical protein ABZS79_13015 [Streptomyces griseoloalbus]|uniref:hypothetical protein n=1 Tax=Streptomyces griseoloalbus TaxID=67303 RepID=UPI0033AF8888
MIRGRGRHPEDGQVSALVAEAEGHLMAQAHLDAARREAGELCAELSWLTAAQAEDVERHYVRRRLDFTRVMLRSTAERAAQLRQEYETRYAELRRDVLTRHAVCALAVLTAAAGLGTLAGRLAR